MKRSEEDLGSRDDRRIRLRSNMCERNITDIKRVFTPGGINKFREQAGNIKVRRFIEK